MGLKKEDKCVITQGATQLNMVTYIGIHFYHMVKVHALFSYAFLLSGRSCVVAIGVVHFSVHSFGCALFVYYTGEKT